MYNGEKKATDNQQAFIVDLGLMTREQAAQLTFQQARELLNAEVPRFHGKKLVLWGVRTQHEVDTMLPRELEQEYKFYLPIEWAKRANAFIDQFTVGEVVWHKYKKVRCTLKAIRRQEVRKNTVNHFTIQYEDGKKEAVSWWAIEKLNVS